MTADHEGHVRTDRVFLGCADCIAGLSPDERGRLRTYHDAARPRFLLWVSRDLLADASVPATPDPRIRRIDAWRPW